MFQVCTPEKGKTERDTLQRDLTALTFRSRVAISMATAPVVGALVNGPAAVPRGLVIVHAVAAAPTQPQRDESHRLNHKKLHITQAALGVDEITNEQVLAMARTLGTLVEFSIDDELHPSPAASHGPRHKQFYLHHLKPIQHGDS